MANTYTQIYIHIVFAVEGRQSLIQPEHNDELQKFIAGIVSDQRQKLIAINNMPDHLHLLVGLRPDSSLSDLVRDIKAGSSKFIKAIISIYGEIKSRCGKILGRTVTPSFGVLRASLGVVRACFGVLPRGLYAVTECFSVAGGCFGEWTGCRGVLTGSFDIVTGGFGVQTCRRGAVKGTDGVETACHRAEKAAGGAGT